MEIRKFLSESYQDYDKGLSSVVFTPNCNYKCPGCHAKKVLEKGELYDTNVMLDYLIKKKRLINKVVLTGGEPSLEEGLLDFVSKLKEKGFLIKLDTNGKNYSALKKILDSRLIDYVAMDVKAPKELYDNVAGIKVDLKKNVEEGMKIITQFPDYEFRTTVQLIDHGKIEWMSPENIKNIAKWIVDVTGKNNHKYFLQTFVAPKKEDVLCERFAKESLEEKFHRTPKPLLVMAQEEAQKYLPNTEIRV